MGGSSLPAVNFNNNINVYTHVNKVVTKASELLGSIYRNSVAITTYLYIN